MRTAAGGGRGGRRGEHGVSDEEREHECHQARAHEEDGFDEASAEHEQSGCHRKENDAYSRRNHRGTSLKRREGSDSPSPARKEAEHWGKRGAHVVKPVLSPVDGDGRVLEEREQRRDGAGGVECDRHPVARQCVCCPPKPFFCEAPQARGGTPVHTGPGDRAPLLTARIRVTDFRSGARRDAL